MKRITAIFCILILTMAMFSACSSNSGSSTADGDNTEGGSRNASIVFADAQWDSIRLHNAVAGLIAVEAFGYTGWSELGGSSPVVHEGMLQGEIDVHMENWTDNLDFYSSDLADGKFKELGINFDDNYQGLYVPRYVIEGDPDRNIEAAAPDLKHVRDLINYADVFPDDEKQGRGRVYGAIPGWVVDEIMFNKYRHYGLDESFEYFRPGSDAAMNAAFSNAYERGEPIVGYYWEPTWLMGKYDFVLLEDEPYTNDEDYTAGLTECPAVVVTVAVSNDFYNNNAEFCEFLSKYKTTSAMISAGLAYMQDEGANYEQAAKWFLTEYPELLDEWLEPDQAEAVRSVLGQG